MASNNLPSITVSDFCKIVKMQFEEKNFRPIFGLGKGGIGKTESIMDLAQKELKIGYIDVRLLLYSETDLKGIPYPNAEHTKTIWLQNDILPNEERDGKEGILVFDEITSCTRSVRTAAYQLLNERRLGEYVLPEGWMIVCLGNGEEDGGDYNGMEGNFVNRCSVFNVIPDLDSWKDWALANGTNELVIGYINFKPSDLHSFEPDSLTEMLFASPRSWKAVSDIMNRYGFNENDRILEARIVANLGQRVGQQFLAFCKYKKDTVDPMEIISGRNLGFKPNSQEIIYITIQSVTKIACDRIIKETSDGGAVSLEALTYLANALKWILSQKTEYAIMGYKDMIRYNPGVITKIMFLPQFQQLCPELQKFSDKNEAIFR